MLFLYLPIRERLSSDEFGEYVTYGIKALRNTRKIIFISDISPSFSFAVSICLKFTLMQLSPIHLLDVLNDIL